MKLKGLIILAFVILFVNIVSAGFYVGNLSHSIDKQYSPSETIKGWINISLSDEQSNSSFKTNSEDSISLIDLIKKNAGFQKTCTPANCETGYSASNPQTAKSFNLDVGESIIFGFNIIANLVAIDSVSFTVESDASSSCYNQLKMDFFNDESIDVTNKKTPGTFCLSLRSYGCFNDAGSIEEYSLSSTPYCQKIRLTESPGFQIGAWVKEESAGNKELTMALYDLSGSGLETCELTGATAGGSDISCDINYSVAEPADYYVCIYSDGGSGEYKIKGNSNPSVGCGFYGNQVPSETPGAYLIFAAGKRFDDVGTLEIVDSLPNGYSLGGLAENYIINTYGRNGEYIDCSSGCVVPIKFISGEDNQNITIHNLSIQYEKKDAGVVTGHNFYNVSETPALVSADFQKLYLDEGNFFVPDDYGNYTFSLSLGDDEIFSEEITVEKVPVIKNLAPRATASAYPTEFEVTVELLDPNATITNYGWDFGDNKTETTTTNKVTHVYSSIGEYELKITVTDSEQRSSSRIFNITVGSPEEIINRSLIEMQTSLINVKTQIREFDSFYQESLNSVLDLRTLEDRLTEIQKDFITKASTEEDFNKIMTDLLNLKVPKLITTTKSADLILFYPEEDNINPAILQEIGGGNYSVGDKSKYVDAILAWHYENIETKITFKELSAKYEYFEEPILRVFELKINEKNSLEYHPYFILRKLDELKFKENYLENEKSGYVYIDLESANTIVFSTTEDVDFSNLPVFISPELSRLVIEKEPDIEKGKISKWVFFILIIIFLIIMGFITYIILQEWYKRKYEKYLFKNRNHLYNLITYIENAKNKELKNNEIRDKLKKAGWNSEQIKYAIKKHSGKRTGMLELPIVGILFKKKKVQEIPQGKKLPIRRLKQSRRYL